MDAIFRYQGQDSCYVCRYDLNDTEVCAHIAYDEIPKSMSPGYEHPIHKECLDGHIKIFFNIFIISKS